MTKLTLVRGVSGSGKSTWAREQNAAVVSRDTIRLALHGDAGIFTAEDEVTFIEHAAIEAYLKAGKDVISDNTNIEMKYVKAMAKIAYRLGAEVELKVFDVPLDKALRNNAHRAMMGGRHVPEDVIRKQHSRFQGTKNHTLEPAPTYEPYVVPDKYLREAVLVDIDGTLAHMNNKRGPFEWHNVEVDDLDEIVYEIVEMISGYGWATIIMSGRDEAARAGTERWFDKHNIYYDEFFMRPLGDMRPDNLVKYELFNNHIRDNYNVKFVLDDRQQVVDMWRAIGLKCLQVAPSFD